MRLSILTLKLVTIAHEKLRGLMLGNHQISLYKHFTEMHENTLFSRPSQKRSYMVCALVEEMHLLVIVDNLIP